MWHPGLKRKSKFIFEYDNLPLLFCLKVHVNTNSLFHIISVLYNMTTPWMLYESNTKYCKFIFSGGTISISFFVYSFLRMKEEITL